MFYPYIADKVDEWVLSKEYSSWPVCDSIGREKKVHEILKPAYCDLQSEESLRVQGVFERLGIAHGWTPDPSQKLFIMHTRDDDYVPVQSARNIIDFLTQNGYEASIVPGKTNLQTNFVIKRQGHLVGMVLYAIQTAAALKAWPVMYTDGQLNPIYDTILASDFEVSTILQQLQAAGIDVQSIIKNIITQLGGDNPDTGNVDIEAIKAQFAALAAQAGIDLDEILEILADSGYDIDKLINDVIAFLSQPTQDPQEGAAAKLMQPVKATITPAAQYEQQLEQWLNDKNVR